MLACAICQCTTVRAGSVTMSGDHNRALAKKPWDATRQRPLWRCCLRRVHVPWMCLNFECDSYADNPQHRSGYKAAASLSLRQLDRSQREGFYLSAVTPLLPVTLVIADIFYTIGANSSARRVWRAIPVTCSCGMNVSKIDDRRVFLSGILWLYFIHRVCHYIFSSIATTSQLLRYYKVVSTTYRLPKPALLGVLAGVGTANPPPVTKAEGSV